MLVIRPVTLNDVDALLGLAQLTSFGLTTLPKDRALLERRVRDSLRGFEKIDDEPRDDAFLFVMQDTDTGCVVGTCGMVSKVGGFQPFYAYRIKTTVHRSKQLNVRKQVKALHLVKEHNGPSEIGSLFLHPDHRRGGNGRTLSLSRFLFMAEHRRLFDAFVIAEMRGVIDHEGHSPFWDAVGRHFFDLDLPKADYLSIVNKEFIGDLMPTHPIYIPLLPPEAQAVIGQVHDETRPALKILQSEGFAFCGMVDIFEAGPILRCPLSEIRTVRESRVAEVEAVTDEPIESEPYLVSNNRRAFRAAQTRLLVEPAGSVRLGCAAAAALEVKPGDAVRYVKLFPPAREEGVQKSGVQESRMGGAQAYG